jgi:hypothetical protein
MFPEAKPALFMTGAGHVVNVPDPSFPDGTGFGSIDRALSLHGVCRIGDFPFTNPARFARIFFSVKLTFNRHIKLLS